MIFWENQKVITVFYAQCVKPVCDKYLLTRMEYNILMFLANNPEYDTAADIVRIRKLTKSHVSSSVKSLEAKGFLQQEYQHNNRKTIHLKICSLAEPIIHDGKEAQFLFGHRLLEGFSEKEKNACLDMFQRLCKNAQDGIEEEISWSG